MKDQNGNTNDIEMDNVQSEFQGLGTEDYEISEK